MSANVGLSTPRGSGTSGYVQRNLSHLKPRDNDRRNILGAPISQPQDQARHTQRQPDPAILEHERKRRMEVQIFELRDKLEEAGELDEDEVDAQVDKLREKLEREENDAAKNKVNVKAIKGHQVHDLAKAKIEETEKVRKAFGIARDYEEGSHWKRQEERKSQAAQAEVAGEQYSDDDEDVDAERERRFERERRRRSYRDRDGERWNDQRSRSRSPDR